jgi:hypothetical protein
LFSIIRISTKCDEEAVAYRTAHREDADGANGGGVSVEDIGALTVRVEVRGLGGTIGQRKETKQGNEAPKHPQKKFF